MSVSVSICKPFFFRYRKAAAPAAVYFYTFVCMKRFLPLLLVALALSACGNRFAGDPVAEALQNYIVSHAPEGCQFALTELQKVDSTTIATELERRTGIFAKRLEKNEELYVRYRTDGHPKNAELKRLAMKKDQQVLQDLAALRESLGERIHGIAYYDYRFSGHLTKGRRSVDYQDAWFTISPSDEVLVVVTDPRDLHKSGGLAIPGYREIIKDADPE